MSLPQIEADQSSAVRSSAVWRWSIVGMLFLATVLNYLDRQTLSVTAVMVTIEFHLSNEQYGWLVSSFRWTYALLHVPAGFIVDRFSVRGFFALAVIFWSLAGASAFWVRGAVTFAATRGLLGIGEAFNWPCALRVTANILPPRDRSLGNGFFNAGSAAGSLIAPFLIAPIAVAYGWRTAFLIVGGLGGAWVLAWLLLTGPASSHRSVETPYSTSQKTQREGFLIQLQQVFQSPGFWFLLVGAGTINPCWYFLTEWLAKYLFDQRDMDVARAAIWTVPIFLGADLGNILGGALVKFLVGRGHSLHFARGMVAALGALLSPATILANYVDNRYVCILLLAVGACGIMVLIVNIFACQQEVSFASVGLVQGLLGGFGCVVGATVNPWIGKYIDSSGNYNLIFLLVGLVPVLSLFSILIFDVITPAPAAATVSEEAVHREA